MSAKHVMIDRLAFCTLVPAHDGHMNLMASATYMSVCLPEILSL